MPGKASVRSMGESTDPSGRAGPRRGERPIQVSPLSRASRAEPCDGLTPVNEEGRGSVMWHSGTRAGRCPCDESLRVGCPHPAIERAVSERRAGKRERGGDAAASAATREAHRNQNQTNGLPRAKPSRGDRASKATSGAERGGAAAAEPHTESRSADPSRGGEERDPEGRRGPNRCRGPS